jgi:hypothetical protein
MIIEELVPEIDPKLGRIFTQIIKYSNGEAYKRTYWPAFDSVVPFKNVRVYPKISIKPKKKLE